METITISSNSVDTTTAAAGIAAGVIITFALVGLALIVLRIIARWKIFEKAGEKGWKALIPFYNDYIFYKIIDMVPFFWALLISGIGLGIISSVTGGYNTWVFESDGSVTFNSAATMSPIVGLLGFAVSVFSIVAAIIAAIRTAKVFGKGGGTIAGLILVPDIFLMILGFGSAKYDKKALKK